MLKKFKLAYLLAAFFIALALLAGCGGGGGGGIATRTFETDQGTIRCLDYGTYYACLGVPYAAPPVGDLRFAPPADPADRGTTVYNATSFRSACPQNASQFGTASTNEDCLYLNIYIPKTGTTPFPVMFWIHGGAFIYGSGDNPPYDPQRLLREGVILVTINYRLGALGFLPHPALMAEHGQPGNYGLMDQAKALEWVQNNIANFNGDLTNVTIFGESAGGHSVMSLLVAAPDNINMPPTSSLFHRAIAESGSFSATQMSMNNGFFVFGLPFATLPGPIPSPGPCANGGVYDAAAIRACLRSLSVDTILATQATGLYIPVYQSGTFLPQSISDGLSNGDFNQVPIIIGSNRDEGTLFAALYMGTYNNFTTLDNLVDGLEALFFGLGYDEQQIAEDYVDRAIAVTESDTHPNNYRLAYSMIFTDSFFNCFNFAQWYQLATYVDTYGYWFQDRQAPNGNWGTLFGAAFLPVGVGATHTLEIPYAWGWVGARGGTANQIALSERMVRYWTRFAKTGDPNGGTDPEWPAFDSDEPSIMSFDDDDDEADQTINGATSALLFMNVHNCLYWQNPPMDGE